MKFPSSMWVISSDVDALQGDQRFFRSLNGGVNWNQVDLLVGDRRAFGLTVHPSRPDCAVLLRVSQNTEPTIDGGLTFESLGVPYLPLAFVADGRVLFAADSGGLYRTEIFDTAAPWEGYLGQLDALPPSWEEEASQVVRRAADLGIDFWLQRTDKDEGLPAASATASVDELVDRLLFHQDYCDLVGKRLLSPSYS